MFTFRYSLYLVSCLLLFYKGTTVKISYWLTVTKLEPIDLALLTWLLNKVYKHVFGDLFLKYVWNFFVHVFMFLLTLPLLLYLWLWNQVQNFMIFFAITRDVMLLVTISLVENFNKVHWLINLNILPINYFLCNFTTFFTTFLVVFMAGKFQIWTYLLNLVEDLCLIFGNVAVLKYVSWMSSRNFFTHKCFASIEFA